MQDLTVTEKYHYLRAVMYPEVVIASNFTLEIMACFLYNVLVDKFSSEKSRFADSFTLIRLYPTAKPLPPIYSLREFALLPQQ